MVKHSLKTLDATFGALADPTRRRLLEQLAAGPARVTDLASPHPISLPAVSRHLRVLEEAGLIERRRAGRVHRMTLRAEPMREAARWLGEYQRFWQGSLDALADYLEKNIAQNKTK
jgi:DNA-binding transcriptional ArsR family regulator